MRAASWLGGLALLYLLASGACFLLYAFDKRAARRGARRTPERTLLLLGFLCGWPGALLAQHWLRHKSAKTSFLLPFWLTVLANLGLVLVLVLVLVPDLPPQG
jgi:uncharacterized membrane protein YsdA (DUF1294 family)